MAAAEGQDGGAQPGVGAAMGQPVTRYARAGDLNIAYQVVGDGPVDLVLAYGLASNIEVFWEEPSFAAFLRRLSEFARVILFDRRGCGLSDRHGTTARRRSRSGWQTCSPCWTPSDPDVPRCSGCRRAAPWRRCSRRPTRSGRPASSSTARRPGSSDAQFRRGGRRRDGWFRRARGPGWGCAAMAVGLWAPSLAGDERFTEWMARYAHQSVSRGAILPLVGVLRLRPHRRLPRCPGADPGAASPRRPARPRRPDARSPSRSPMPGSSSWPASTISPSLATRRRYSPRWRIPRRVAGSDQLRRRLLTLVLIDIADSMPTVSIW